MKDYNRLLFKDVALYFLYTSFLENKLNLLKLKRNHPDCVIESEKIDTRFFHQRYVRAVTPVYKIIFPSFKINGIDVKSFSQVPCLEDILRKVFFNNLLIQYVMH